MLPNKSLKRDAAEERRAPYLSLHVRHEKAIDIKWTGRQSEKRVKETG